MSDAIVRIPGAIPPSYLPATWRCTTPIEADGSVGLGFNLADGSVVRLKLDGRSIKQILESIYAMKIRGPLGLEGAALRVLPG